MANMTLGLDAATLVIMIGGKTFTLTGGNADLSLPDALPAPELPRHLRFQYKDTYENAIAVGTLGQLLQEVETMLQNPSSPTPVVPLVVQWTEIENKLKSAPILSSAATVVESTDVRIFEIGIELTKENKDATAFTGQFRLGLVFTPAAGARPKLFNVQFVSFGAVLTLQLEGVVSDLGSWSN